MALQPAWRYRGHFYQADFLESVPDHGRAERYFRADPGRVYVRYEDAGEVQQIFLALDRAVHILQVLRVMANKLTTAANAIVLQYAAPIFILLMSAFLFKQKLHKREVIVVGITMCGIVLFFLDQLSPGNI